MPALRIEAAALTHRGAVRAMNQDCLAIGSWIAQEDIESARRFAQPLEEPFVCLVADGMGGHPAGDIASRLAAECLASLLPGAEDDRIIPAIRQVNAQFYAVMQRFPGCTGMGTTVAGLIARPRGIAVFNVGDSRAYRVSGSGLVQLTVDDSAEPEWDHTSFVPRSGMLTQSIGGGWEFMDVVPHLHLEPCEAGSTYLICSDGLYDALALEEIAALIGHDLATSVEALFGAAMETIARDNVSVALVRIAAGGAGSTAA
jgi:serine/threonine protein phosphatase PrpC